MKFRGFSLIELLVSMTVVSILMAAAFAMLRPQDYFAKTRDSRRTSDLKVVQTALEQYYANNNGYPSGTLPWGAAWAAGTPPVTYLRSVPSDPSGTTQYCYAPVSSGYELCAVLEKSSGTAGTAGGCGATYNYCVSNPF